ncbi:MAG: hypothetical protein ACFE9I_04200 [Candidatus Hermodarchaeota archaeon]
MKVKHVDFLLTFKCTAECRHCSYKAAPNRTGCIKPKQTYQYLEELIKIFPLESVWVHGGEPFLYFESLEQIIRKANEMDIP